MCLQGEPNRPMLLNIKPVEIKFHHLLALNPAYADGKIMQSCQVSIFYHKDRNKMLPLSPISPPHTTHTAPSYTGMCGHTNNWKAHLLHAGLLECKAWRNALHTVQTLLWWQTAQVSDGSSPGFSVSVFCFTPVGLQCFKHIKNTWIKTGLHVKLDTTKPYCKTVFVVFNWWN